MELHKKFKVSLTALDLTFRQVHQDLNISAVHLHEVIHGRRKSPRVMAEVERIISEGFSKLGIKKIPQQ
jgi:hypothetical protein